jgi:hypothetical protein
MIEHILPDEIRPRDVPICRPVSLPDHMIEDAARVAIHHNPQNGVNVASLNVHLPAMAQMMTPYHLAVMTGKNWKPGTVILVGFMESGTPQAVRDKVLSHMSAWSTSANISFREVRGGESPMIRVSFRGDGYYSYIGTDNLSVPPNQLTMSLQGFDAGMPESEWRRVVRHETGHALGFPHEHSRKQIIELLDPAGTLRYFQQTQAWSPQMIQEQILTPISEASIMGTPNAETDSIMCYQFPGACTRSGQPIPGGLDITPDDYAFAAKVYPGVAAPGNPTPNPNPPPPNFGLRLRGYFPADPISNPRPTSIYLTDAEGHESGYGYRGTFRLSNKDRGMVLFDGPAVALPASALADLEAHGEESRAIR